MRNKDEAHKIATAEIERLRSLPRDQLLTYIDNPHTWEVTGPSTIRTDVLRSTRRATALVLLLCLSLGLSSGCASDSRPNQSPSKGRA